MPTAEPLDAEGISSALTSLAGWTGDPGGIERSYDFPSFLAAVRAVGAVAEVAEAMDHHPDIDIRWRTVRFACSTHSAGGVTGLDLELAARIDELATAAGAA